MYYVGMTRAATGNLPDQDALPVWRLGKRNTSTLMDVWKQQNRNAKVVLDTAKDIGSSKSYMTASFFLPVLLICLLYLLYGICHRWVLLLHVSPIVLFRYILVWLVGCFNGIFCTCVVILFSLHV